MGRMVRTNVVVDQTLLEEVRERYGLRSKRETIDFALRTVLGTEGDTSPQRAALRLQGTWADRTDEEMREIYGEDWWGA